LELIVLEKNRPEINIANILQAASAPVSFCRKITKPNYNNIKAVQTLLYEKKLLVKCWVKFTPAKCNRAKTHPIGIGIDISKGSREVTQLLGYLPRTRS